MRFWQNRFLKGQTTSDETVLKIFITKQILLHNFALPVFFSKDFVQFSKFARVFLFFSLFFFAFFYHNFFRLYKKENVIMSGAVEGNLKIRLRSVRNLISVIQGVLGAS